MMEKKITSKSDVSINITITLTETEARALREMISYGIDPFLKWFYTNLGKHYLGPHEAGMRSLFETIRRELPPHLNRADRARKVFYESEQKKS